MIGQRPPGASPVVRAIAEQLPFADHSFDASLAVLTIHHWRDLPKGLAELRRVARRRVVILTWDITASDSFWLTAEYFPEIAIFDSTRHCTIDELADGLGRAKVIPVPVPRDCQDGFLAAFGPGPRSTSIPADVLPCPVSRNFPGRLTKAASSGWRAIFNRALGISDSGSY